MTRDEIITNTEDRDENLTTAYTTYLTTHFPDRRYKHGALDYGTLTSKGLGDGQQSPVLVRTYREGETIKHDVRHLARDGISGYCGLLYEIYEELPTLEGPKRRVPRDARFYIRYGQVVPTDTPHVWRVEDQYTVDHGKCNCQTFETGWCGHELAVEILEALLHQLRLPPSMAPAISWYEEL